MYFRINTKPLFTEAGVIGFTLINDYSSFNYILHTRQNKYLTIQPYAYNLTPPPLSLNSPNSSHLNTNSNINPYSTPEPNFNPNPNSTLTLTSTLS